MRSPFAQIRSDERSGTYRASLVLFGTMAGHALLETARDALFLSRIPPSQLGWVYLAIAVVALGISGIQNRRLSARQNWRGLFNWLLFSSGLTLTFWLLCFRPSVWVFYGLYIWSGVFSTLVVVRFWTLLGNIFTVVQAKRIYAVVGVGGVLGAIVGSGLAGVVTYWSDASSILVVAAVVLVLTAFGSAMGISRPKRIRKILPASAAAESKEFAEPLRKTWGSHYLRRVAAIILISTVTLTLVDFLFKSTVVDHIPAENLATFFAATYFSFNLLSLLAQLFLVGWLVRSLAVDRVLSLLPFLLAFGALGVAMGGGLIAALFLKSLDGTLRHSLQSTATEVLFVPLKTDLRARVKGLIDVLGRRGGQAIASFCILGVIWLGHTFLILSLVVSGLAIAWIAVARSIKGHYLDLFRETLNEGTVATRFEFPDLDLASLETLLASLNSTNDAEVLAALDLLAEEGRVRLLPALILYHPSPQVVIRALELFSREGRKDFIPIAERLLESAEGEVRAATLRAISWVAPRPEVFERLSDDASPIVRATALIGRVSYGSLNVSEAEYRMQEIAASGSLEERLSLARAIRYSPGAAYSKTLLALAESQELDVQLAVAEAMAEIRSPTFIPALVSMLGSRQLRYQARTTLTAIGDESLQQLKDALENEDMDIRTRAQVPRAIAEFPDVLAAKTLLSRLRREPSRSIRYRIVRALLSLRTRNPNLSLDETVLGTQAERTLRHVFRFLSWRLLMEEANQRDPSRATEVQSMILDLLDHKCSQAVERLFHLLVLLYPQEDIRSIYRGLSSSDKEVQTSSLELLGNLLNPPLREPVLAIVDTVGEQEKLARAGVYNPLIQADYESLLRVLLSRPGVGVRCLVAYHIEELGLNNLMDALERLTEDPEEVVARTAWQSIEQLRRVAEA